MSGDYYVIRCIVIVIDCVHQLQLIDFHTNDQRPIHPHVTIYTDLFQEDGFDTFPDVYYSIVLFKVTALSKFRDSNKFH